MRFVQTCANVMFQDFEAFGTLGTIHIGLRWALARGLWVNGGAVVMECDMFDSVGWYCSCVA